MKKLILVSMLASLFVFACAPAEEPAKSVPEPVVETAPEPVAEPEPMLTAVAVLRDPEGQEVGKATFAQTEGGVMLAVEVKGVERDGPHDFRVHEVGACEPDFKAAGGHFKPEGTERHAGDFGNIEIIEGNGRLEIRSELVTVTPGETSVVGRAVILHAGADNGVGQPTGDAGSRLACGLIELVKPGGGVAEEAEDDDEGERGES